MAKERIGLMGGAFNPIHERHLAIAACALAEARLSRIIFLPTGNPPHKREGLADAEHRFEMTRLATLGEPRFAVSRIELDRTGVIYTVDTLQLLRQQLPDADFFYIIGEDTLLDLPHWRTPDRVFELCAFLVCRRSTWDASDHPTVEELVARGAKLQYLSLPPLDVSATDIRKRLAAGETPPEVPPQVMEYIRIMGLYGVPARPEGAAEMYPRLRLALSDRRLLHSLLVAATARDLARIHGQDQDACELAGLMHDCAKCMPLQTLQRIARDRRLLLDKETLANENLLHGPVGAEIAENEYGVCSPNILSAIRCHTTGRVGMLPTDMILFLADKIEPSRRSYPGLEEVRALAGQSLVEATLRSMRSTRQYVSRQKAPLHPMTQRVITWLERLPQTKS
ncbi:MAG: nicotinate (nicotinamide) nucleotide adenylyltransferase [Clostridiales bacterium]|nr:nicotinate (nicotinamide) nucleotide adenylyltransferase [Clostridiales bacterium]